MDAKHVFWKQFGVDGKPVAIIRIIEAAWAAATFAERKACAELCDSHGIDTGEVTCLGCGEILAAEILSRSSE